MPISYVEHGWFDRAPPRRPGDSGFQFRVGSSLQNLQQLVVMRNIAAVAQAVTILVVDRGLGIALPVVPMGAAIVFLLAFNYYTWQRTRRADPVSEREIMFQLTVDVGVLTLQLGLAGGAANPFAGMYLLPLAVLAAWLPWTYTWTFALATLLCYSLIVFVFRPLTPAGDEARMLPLLVAGMWVNYVITAAMIAHFVARITSSMREHDRLLGDTRERAIVNENVVRIGALAAGAAHELATPMATMALVVEELREQHADDTALKQSLSSLHSQLRSCRQTLSDLLEYSDRAFARDGTTLAADRFLRQTLDAFHSRQPDTQFEFAVDTLGMPPDVPNDLALAQAISSLLSNAADASSEPIEVRLQWSHDTLRIVVRDRGPGIPPEIKERVGSLFFTTKEKGKGNGLGLCLANLAVTRLGGALRLDNADGGGAVASIELPTASAGACAPGHA